MTANRDDIRLASISAYHHEHLDQALGDISQSLEAHLRGGLGWSWTASAMFEATSEVEEAELARIMTTWAARSTIHVGKPKTVTNRVITRMTRVIREDRTTSAYGVVLGCAVRIPDLPEPATADQVRQAGTMCIQLATERWKTLSDPIVQALSDAVGDTPLGPCMGLALSMDIGVDRMLALPEVLTQDDRAEFASELAYMASEDNMLYAQRSATMATWSLGLSYRDAETRSPAARGEAIQAALADMRGVIQAMVETHIREHVQMDRPDWSCATQIAIRYECRGRRAAMGVAVTLMGDGLNAVAQASVALMGPWICGALQRKMHAAARLAGLGEAQGVAADVQMSINPDDPDA